MKKRWTAILLVLIVSVGAFMMSSILQKPLTADSADNNREIVKGYTSDLQAQRESCYNNILLLGTLNEQQVQTMKWDLKRYLNEVEKINNLAQSEEIENKLLHESIELDMLLIKKTLTAIETKDESYLNNISEIYSNLVKYQLLLGT